MDVSSVSVLWYKRSKPLGKVRRRVQDLRVPSSAYSDCSATRPALDLSHNESARLAVDCLLSQGKESYRQMLQAEGEVDFLSELEKSYILNNGTDGNTDDPGSCDGKDVESFSAASWSALSTDTEPDVQVSDSVRAQPSVEVYFQCDSKAAGLKDLVREFIRKANVALAIVMDVFSDVELLCDLLEATRKRNVSVYLLLDHLNLSLFVTMWQNLKLNSSDFPKLSVGSANGQTYCAKSGRKLTGEIAENFIIADWTEVLTGSYSFSWLSWQVHRSLCVLVKGSAAAPFHQEFHRLYFSSTPVPGFVTFITLPLHTSHATHYNSCGNSKAKSSQTKTCQLAGPEDAQHSHMQTNNQPLHKAAVDEHSKPPQLHPKAVVQPGTKQPDSVGNSKHGVGISTLHDTQTYVKPVEENRKQAQSCANRQISNIQSQLVSLNISNITEKVKVRELNSVLANPSHQPHRSVRYQSTLTKHFGCLPSENFRRAVPSTSQQKQAQTNLQVFFSPSGLAPSGFHPKVSSLGAKLHCQPPLQPHLTTDGCGLELTPRAGDTQLKPRLPANAKVFLPDATAKRRLQPPLLNWTPQTGTVRTRPVARTSSFDTMYGTGQTSAGLLGWKSAHRSRSSLGRSKSLTERRTTGLHPNITTI